MFEKEDKELEKLTEFQYNVVAVCTGLAGVATGCALKALFSSVVSMAHPTSTTILQSQVMSQASAFFTSAS
eukprot:g49177.t1